MLVAFTESGGTPRLISKARPGVPIVAFASDEAHLRRLALYWGVVPRLLALPAVPDTDTLVDRAIQTMLEQKLVDDRRPVRDGVRLARRPAHADQHHHGVTV